MLPLADFACRWEWLPRGDCRSRGCLLTAALPLTFSDGTRARSQGTVLPACCAGVRGDWRPWDAPGRQRLAGGRPQLAAGIRAASYAYECSNPHFPASMQQFGGNRQNRRCNGIFTKSRPKQWTCAPLAIVAAIPFRPARWESRPPFKLQLGAPEPGSAWTGLRPRGGGPAQGLSTSLDSETGDSNPSRMPFCTGHLY